MDGSMQDGNGEMLSLRRMNVLRASWTAPSVAAGGVARAAGCRCLTDGEDSLTSPVTISAKSVVEGLKSLF